MVLVYPSDVVGAIALDPLSCSTGDRGDPAVCDAADALQLSFPKPSQGGGFSGFDLYRADRSTLQSPVIPAAACVVAGFGSGAATGETVAVVESPAFAPAVGAAAFYVVGHRPASGAGPVPADLGRRLDPASSANGPPTVRFVDPACP